MLSAAAKHGRIHPQFRTRVNFVHCAGSNEVQNVNLAAPITSLLGTRRHRGAGRVPAGGRRVCSPGMPWVNASCSNFPGAVGCFSNLFDGNIRGLTIDLNSLFSTQVRTGSVSAPPQRSSEATSNGWSVAVRSADFMNNVDIRVLQ